MATTLGRGGSRPGDIKPKLTNTKTPMFDKLREMNASSPAVKLMQTTAEQVRKENAAATGTPYNVSGATTSYDPVYTGKISSSYVPGTLGNQKVGLSGGGTGSGGGGNLPPPPIPDAGGGEFDVQGYIDDYDRKQREDMLRNIRAAFDQNRGELAAQKPAIQQETTDMRNRVDTGYFQSLPELYKALEAAGQRGGENITGTVNLNTARQEGQNQASLYEANQLRNIENAILGLDAQQAQVEAEGSMGINTDVFSAKLGAIKDAMSQATADRNAAKSDFENTIGAFGDNFQAEINRLTNLANQGITTEGGVPIAYKIAALNRERNNKKTAQAEAAYEATQDDEANALAWARINKSGSGGSLSYDEAFDLYLKGEKSPAVLKALGMQ